MSWYVKYDPATKIAELVYTGRITSEELIASVAERIQVQKQHSTILTLTDASQIERLDIDILDIHNLPARLYGSAEVNRETHLALLPPQRCKGNCTPLCKRLSQSRLDCADI